MTPGGADEKLSGEADTLVCGIALGGVLAWAVSARASIAKEPSVAVRRDRNRENECSGATAAVFAAVRAPGTAAYLAGLEDLAARLDRAFGDRFGPARKTLKDDIAWMKRSFPRPRGP